MAGIAQGRLAAERRNWRKDHPHRFVAKPDTLADGSTNLMRWTCTVPGREGTIWAPGEYTVKLRFTSDYPTKPPICAFEPKIFHPNVYDDGRICLNIINDPAAGGAWTPCITIKQILLGVQRLLEEPNNNSAASYEAHRIFAQDQKQYVARVKQQAVQFTPRE